MQLAVAGRVDRAMRLTTMVGLSVCSFGHGVADADPLWQAEVRAGYGLESGGAGTRMSKKPTPLTLAAIASLAIEDHPRVWGFGGLAVEMLDRNAAGVTAGVRLEPAGSKIRLAAGGTVLVAPYTLWGATVAGGTCMRVMALASVCGDVQLTAYFAGGDLADAHQVNQLQLVIGMVFDAI